MDRIQMKCHITPNGWYKYTLTQNHWRIQEKGQVVQAPSIMMIKKEEKKMGKGVIYFNK